VTLLSRIRRYFDRRAKHEAEQLVHSDLKQIYDWEARVQARIGLTPKEREFNRREKEEKRKASRARNFFNRYRKQRI
jgi:hypothetical protein